MGFYWRISNYIDLSGEGGRVASARWHTAGQRIVYLAESPAVAMFEALVHLEYDVEDFPDEFTLLKVSAPDSLKVSLLDPSENPDWREKLEFTRGIGDAWLSSRESSLARVPSAIVPQASNYLLNPEHPDAKLVQIEGQSSERLDIRLSRKKLR
ncbi:MAG: RES family NAD+ phosphorylase [Terracidiphilus sp.]|jgi:RES domain-containing protein